MVRRCWWLLGVAPLLLAGERAAAQAWTGPHGPNGGAVSGLALDPGGATRAFATVEGDGIHRSTNGGTSWTRVFQGNTSQRQAHAVVIHPMTTDTVYVGSNDGVWVSTNGGDDWADSSSGLGNDDDTWSLAIDPTNPLVLYAGTDIGVYKTDDGGGDWDSSTSGLGTTNRRVQAIAIQPGTPSTLLAGTSAAGLFRSTNAGGSWTQVTAGIPGTANVQAILFDPAAPSTVWVGTGAGLFRSTDGGLSFSASNGSGGTALPSTDVQALAIHHTSLYAGTASGVAISTNGGAAWTTSLAAQNTRSLAVDGWIALAGSTRVYRQLRVTKTISSGDWNTAGQWTPSGVPGASDVCLVQGDVTVNASSPSAARLVVRGGGTLTIGASRTLTLSGPVDVQDGVVALDAAGATLSAGGPVTVSAASRVQLSSTGQLRLAGGASLTVRGTLRGRSTTAAISRSAGAAGIDVQVLAGGELDVDGLTFRDGDAEGLHVRAGATLTRLRRARFEGLGTAAAGARYLTLESDDLLLSAPGAFFGALGAGQSNVLLIDTAGGTTDDVVLVLEDRGAATSGAGAGEALDAEQGGAQVTWVWACPDTTRGTAVGAPTTAFDLNTFADYATYVAFRDVDAAGVDRIHVFDPSGGGVEAAYWFEVPDNRGDIVGLPWWDTSPTGQHLLWATTTNGNVFLWQDTGTGAGARPTVSGWPVQIVSSFSTGPVADRTNIYAAGRYLFFPFIGGVDRATLALEWAAFTSAEVRSGLATELNGGVNYVFGGSQRGGDGRARIFRVDALTHSVDLTNTDATADILGAPYVILGKGLFVADMAGRVHGLDQMTFTRKPGFPVTASPSPIRAGVFLDFVNDDRVYAGDEAGRLIVIEPTGGLVPGWGIQPMGTAAVRGTPLVDAGVLWASNADGRVVSIDVSTRATLEQWRLGAGAVVSDLSQEFSAGRTMVSTSRGGFYVVAVKTDPTP